MRKRPCIKYISPELTRVIEKEMERTNKTFVDATREVARRLQNV